jgi:hypothetical protein
MEILDFQHAQESMIPDMFTGGSAEHLQSIYLVENENKIEPTRARKASIPPAYSLVVVGE